MRRSGRRRDGEDPNDLATFVQKSREITSGRLPPPESKRANISGATTDAKGHLSHLDTNRLMSVINTLCVCRHRSRGSLSPEEGSLSLSLWHICIWLYTPILPAVAAVRETPHHQDSSAWTFCATSPRRRYSPPVSRSHSRSAIEYRAQRARRYGTSGRGSRR